jgi:plastocyanin
MRNALAGVVAAIFLSVPAAVVVGQVKASEAAQQEITIENFHFAPATLTVPAGTRVIWVNRDDAPHKVASTDNKFAASPALDTGEQYGIRFKEPGTYDYFCSLHPKMTGRVVVR